MPQGGIDRGEKAIEAAKREMQEETGIKKNFRVIHESHDWHYYDLPMQLQKKLWRGRYVGQKQRWYVIDFYGSDNEINIKTKRPEFQTWRWSTKNEILKKTLQSRRIRFRRHRYVNWVSIMFSNTRGVSRK